MTHKYFSCPFYWVMERDGEKLIHPYGYGCPREAGETPDGIFVYYRDCYISVDRLGEDGFSLAEEMAVRAKDFEFMTTRDLVQLLDSGIFNEAPAKWNPVPLWTPHANRDAARPYWMTQSRKAGAALLWKPPVFSSPVSTQTVTRAAWVSGEENKRK